MIAGFCVYANTLYYSPNRYKKGRNSVSQFQETLTPHQNVPIYLIANLFNHRTSCTDKIGLS
jgi:hypothetical protein